MCVQAVAWCLIPSPIGDRQFYLPHALPRAHICLLCVQCDSVTMPDMCVVIGGVVGGLIRSWRILCHLLCCCDIPMPPIILCLVDDTAPSVDAVCLTPYMYPSCPITYLAVTFPCTPSVDDEVGGWVVWWWADDYEWKVT